MSSYLMPRGDQICARHIYTSSTYTTCLSDTFIRITFFGYSSTNIIDDISSCVVRIDVDIIRSPIPIDTSYP